jgi:hypothetical protein
MLGPLWAGAAFQHLSIGSPFWIAAGLMVVVRIFAGTVKFEPFRFQDSQEIEAVIPTEV